MVFLDEPYRDEIMREQGGGGRNKAFLHWPRVTKGIETKNQKKWEQELSAREIALFESQAGDLLKDLGYPLVYDKFGDELRLELARLVVAAYVERWCGLVKRSSVLLARQLGKLS